VRSFPPPIQKPEEGQLSGEERRLGLKAHTLASDLIPDGGILNDPRPIPLGRRIAIGKDVILLISSNDSFAHSLKKFLSENGYLITLASNESIGIVQAKHQQTALVLVDRLSANFKTIRQHPAIQKVPVVTVQQPGLPWREEDCEDDLDAGADAWLCNQTYRQLLARIRAILRRLQYGLISSNHLEAGGIRVDVERHEVSVYDRSVKLTPKEFKILTQFARVPNRVFSRQELLNRIWGEDYALEEHALDVHIHSLRQKIEPNPSQPIFIVTVRKVGFKLLAG
jgi:DNA-binding response OmpR family regulator